MNAKNVLICVSTFLVFLPLARVRPVLAARPIDDVGVITMDQEPHHDLALQNDYVKVFNVQVAPGDSIVLHRHDQDTVAIAIGEQLVAVGIPGKPDVHQKNADAQVRLQASGYVHSTRVDGNTPYHTVAVELLRPQTNFHNVCAEILAGRPLNCLATPASASSASVNRVLLASDQTEVRMVRVLPRQSAKLARDGDNVSGEAAELIVALDSGSISSSSAKEPAKKLQPGDFVWLDAGDGSKSEFQNAGSNDARFIQFRIHTSQ